MDLKILYEDNHIIVVFKPSGILSQKDITQDVDMLSMVKEYIRVKYNKPGEAFVGLVHRLDRNTSGIMVFAKTSKAASRLCASEMKKTYLAVVEGKVLNNDFIRLEENLYYDEARKKSFIQKNGKNAILFYKSLGYRNDFSLLEIKLQTGRHHQIRCMLSHINHPIVGDLKYQSNYKRGNAYNLCAYKLQILHPTLKKEMEFKYIDLSNDFLLFKDIIENKMNTI